MSTELRKSLIRLLVIVGIVVAALLSRNFVGPETAATITTVLQATGLIILGITILVTIHELGHFLTARAFGMRAEVFSIGFPPKLFSVKVGETDYQIGATPLGGYVKIAGMIDESFDTDHLASEPQPYEFRSKPVWQRLIVMVGGVVMNVILGIFIFSMLAYSYGEQKIPVSELKQGIFIPDVRVDTNKCGEAIPKRLLGDRLGFQSGDHLLSFKGEQLSYLEDYSDLNLLLESDAYFEVLRNGQKVKIPVPENVLNTITNDSVIPQLFAIKGLAQVQVAQEKDETPAMGAGMKTGDLITAIDTFPITYFEDLKDYLAKYKNQEVPIHIERGGKSMTLMANLNEDAILGVRPFIDQDTFKYGFFESFGPGTTRAFSIVSGNAKGFGQIFSGEVDASKSVTGPLGIATKYMEYFLVKGWFGFLELTAMLSMVLAFVNILPIPALDGGHVVFLLIEAVMGREPSPKVRLIAQQVGFFLIIGLMILIIFNDVLRLNAC